MLDVLEAARDLVASSRREGWPMERPSECLAVLNLMIGCITGPEAAGVPRFARIQFAPTGPIQEIALANGWHEEYIRLAEAYDRLEEALHLFGDGDA